MSQATRGVLAAVAACVLWGSTGLFFDQLAHVPTLEAFAHRTVWAVILFTAFLALRGRASAPLRSLRGPGAIWPLLAASLLLAINWLVFVHAVAIEQALEASLGYFIFPLVSVLLGRAVLGERLGRVGRVAVALAGGGVLVLALGLGVTPWIALALGVSFGLYGLVKRRLEMSAILSVTAEAWLILPPCLAWLIWIEAQGIGHFTGSVRDAVLLILSGPMTAVPLMLFTYAAQRISMMSLGLLTYLNPTLQFLAATLILHEPFGIWHAAAFAMIWTALVIYSAATWRSASVRAGTVGTDVK